MATPSRKRATVDDLLESDRLEIIAGEIVEKAVPSFPHATAELELAAAIAPFNRRDPGGWWLTTEIHVSYASGEVYCHDAAAAGEVVRAEPFEAIELSVSRLFGDDD